MEENCYFLFFISIVSAADSLGCSEKTIRRALKADGVIKRKYLVTIST
jgi:DeoR/GlpR family transcriptional regulator of sugar metabolism